MQTFRPLIRPVLMAFVLIGCVSLPIAFGQEKKNEDKAKEKAEAKELVAEKKASDEKAASKKDATILGMIRESGWMGIAFMIVLGLFSLIAVAVVVERLYNLTWGKVIPFAFERALRSLINEGHDDVEAYQSLVKKHDAPVANVLRAGLLRVGRPVPEVEKSMEDALAREMSILRGRVRPLNVIGSVSPLVGLLGTVVGMIMAFYNASQQGLGGKAEILAEGIYLALLTTAAGLTIAIPALLFAAFFNSRIDKFVREMDELLVETIPFFDRMEDRYARQRQAAHELAPEEEEVISH